MLVPVVAPPRHHSSCLKVVNRPLRYDYPMCRIHIVYSRIVFACLILLLSRVLTVPHFLLLLIVFLLLSSVLRR